MFCRVHLMIVSIEITPRFQAAPQDVVIVLSSNQEKVLASHVAGVSPPL